MILQLQAVATTVNSTVWLWPFSSRPEPFGLWLDDLSLTIRPVQMILVIAVTVLCCLIYPVLATRTSDGGPRAVVVWTIGFVVGLISAVASAAAFRRGMATLTLLGTVLTVAAVGLMSLVVRWSAAIKNLNRPIKSQN